MADKPVIRFRCSCGQKISVSARHAGRRGRCPKCRERVKIPKRTDPKAAPAPPKPAPMKPKSDAEIFKAIVAGLGKAVVQHYASFAGYYVKLSLASGRAQSITLRRGKGDVVEMTSEIGMVGSPQQALEALQLAGKHERLRLWADGARVIHASLAVSLPWASPDPFLKAAESLAAGADAIEEKLFGMDLR